MSFSYPRQIHFHETDAAGVVYFANVLTLCHEAYEASLAAADIDLGHFFSAVDEIAIPVVHADVDFFRPLRCGDRICLVLTPQRLKGSEFEIRYELLSAPLSPDSDPSPRPFAQACTRHVCIHTSQRQRRPLSPKLEHWLALFSA